MFKKIKINQNGATAILMAMLVLSAVLIVSLDASDIIKNGIKASKGQLNATKSYFAAEAGAERILWEIRYNSFDIGTQCNNGDYICFDSSVNGNINGCGGCNIDYQKLSNGTEYKIKYNTDGTNIIINNYGSYGEINRVVRLEY